VSTTAITPPAAVSSINRKEKRIVLLLAGAMLAAILLVSFFAPAAEDDDLSPSSYNSGSAGVKAAFLLLPRLGYKTERWEGSASDLGGVDAPHTTLVLANPVIPPQDRADVADAIKDFLNRGGRVLATGAQGAYLIPGGETAEPTQFYKGLCISTPEGQGRLALAGQVSMEDPIRWKSDTVATRVQQRCGGDAVAVTVKVGQGEAVWWSTPLPMTNRGLKEDASLSLLLASIGTPDRRILFDESLHGDAASVWDQARGLPIRSLLIQSGMVAVLLVLSFGRRSGPVRSIAQTVRSSPLEFAESMGHLYNKAGATQVATAGARRRLLRYLHERCGLSHDTLRRNPADIAEALQHRLGGDWSAIAEHLEQAADAGGKALSSKTALELVRAMDRDVEALGKHFEVTQESTR
jgi:Domain of unknown function (DUF4350)